MRQPTHNTKRTLVASALLGLVFLAGCASSDTGNEAPEGMMEATDDRGWVGDPFTFDAQESHDPDGEVVSWHFDFGDGSTMDVRDEDSARVKHTYTQGGEYTVTLTVTDDGGENDGALTDTTELRVAVNEATPVGDTALYASPLANQTDGSEQAFEAHEGVDRFELDLNVTSLILVGTSELRIEVIDPSGDVLAQQVVTVEAGQTKDVSIAGAFEEQGTGKLVFTAESGATSQGGSLALFYDDGY